MCNTTLVDNVILSNTGVMLIFTSLDRIVTTLMFSHLPDLLVCKAALHSARRDLSRATKSQTLHVFAQLRLPPDELDLAGTDIQTDVRKSVEKSSLRTCSHTEVLEG